MVQPELTLVVLAAGLGSRFGGLKQLAAVDDHGHSLIDYSLYDAVRAGFDQVVMVVNPISANEIESTIGGRVDGRVRLSFATQALTDIPPGHTVPAGRTKPWGTAHAVCCAAPMIDGPFATINADDFYGRRALAAASDFLRRTGPARHGLVSYRLDHTLSDNGCVSRGICRADGAGHLVDIIEHTAIVSTASGIIARGATGEGDIRLEPASPVSLNLWAFSPDALSAFSDGFDQFLQEAVPADPLGAEYFLPDVPGRLVRDGLASVELLPTDEVWQGLTYAADLPRVQAAIAALRQEGLYPERLWS
ncbi:MAG: NTP transferase domain-containing protein [Propionibacteriaceae bacterium]|jgi:hypothetical protein|nr:NTP transferase domain-containing protein [Propionibacteriaceae bacterium]